jgi:hypothetical protein
MRKQNPMFSLETREKMSQTLKRIGHRPKIQGGNGRGLTEPQKLLLEKLGDGWYPELVVCTKLKNPYPHHYKIDIANPNLKIAIEVDGGSHFSLKVRTKDKKKQDFLISNNWKVLRFTNKQILENLEKVAGSII